MTIQRAASCGARPTLVWVRIFQFHNELRLLLRFIIRRSTVSMSICCEARLAVAFDHIVNLFHPAT